MLCTGKIGHELIDRRNEEKMGHIAVLRIEQLYPLHEELLAQLLKPFGKNVEFVWCQEEPQNMGSWSFIEPYLRRLTGKDIAYAGREAAASPAPGSLALFNIEQEALIASALGITARKLTKSH